MKIEWGILELWEHTRKTRLSHPRVGVRARQRRPERSHIFSHQQSRRRKRRDIRRWEQLSRLNFPAVTQQGGASVPDTTNGFQDRVRSSVASGASALVCVCHQACWSSSGRVSALWSLTATTPQQVGESGSANVSSVSLTANAAL